MLWSSRPRWRSDHEMIENWLSKIHTLVYTGFASVAKFGIGLYLALLLNKRLPFKALIS
jgi:ABC-type sugar transport system permease subunit